MTPQSSVALVTYKLDAQSRVLTRSELPVPPSQVVTTTEPPDVTLSQRVTSITIELTDSSGATQTAWDYETLAQATASSDSSSSSVSLSDTETTLPIAAKITVEVVSASGGSIQVSTSVAISMPTPQPTGQKPSGPSVAIPAGFGAATYAIQARYDAMAVIGPARLPS